MPEPAVEPADVPNEQLYRSVLVKMELGCETQTLRKSQEILAVLRIPEASSSAGLVLQMRRRELNLAAIIVSAFACSAALAQPEVIRCLAPEVPITDLPEAGIGSRVELWGRQVQVNRVAQAAGTIAYELMCALAPRVPVRAVD